MLPAVGEPVVTATYAAAASIAGPTTPKIRKHSPIKPMNTARKVAIVCVIASSLSASG